MFCTLFVLVQGQSPCDHRLRGARCRDPNTKEFTMSDNHSVFVGEIPKNYDEGLGPNIFDFYGSHMAGLVAKRNPSDILEIAAGTGIVTRKIWDAVGEDSQLTATDLNDAMLDVAREKFADPSALTIEPADAQALPYADDHFDVVTTQFGHMFFPDRPAAYSEGRRVLRPGGTYLFSTWGSMDQNPFSKLIHGVLAEIFDGNPPGFYKVPFSLHDPAAILDELGASGFQNCEHQAVEHQRTIEDVPGFARGLVYGNPSIDEVRSRGGDPEAICEQTSERLRDEFGNSPTTMPLLANFFSATAP